MFFHEFGFSLAGRKVIRTYDNSLKWKLENKKFLNVGIRFCQECLPPFAAIFGNFMRDERAMFIFQLECVKQ